ncbi:MAG TPA: hypothetical protein VIW29_11340 [Polyangiaceae bacterium]
MQPAAERKGTSLLVVRDAERCWAVPSALVLAVQRRGDWAGTVPLDPAELLGAGSRLSGAGASAPDARSAAAGDEARVIVVGTEQQRVPLLARGELALLQLAEGALLELPEPFPGLAPLVARLALEDGAPSIFVLSPERLLEVVRG